MIVGSAVQPTPNRYATSLQGMGYSMNYDKPQNIAAPEGKKPLNYNNYTMADTNILNNSPLSQDINRKGFKPIDYTSDFRYQLRQQRDTNIMDNKNLRKIHPDHGSYH